ncbi:hypothetical protein HWV62_12270 [Athelia sp. TMB]|nr:hypothetical protein HWV62_12270 [Athelia sp. TMB]
MGLFYVYVSSKRGDTATGNVAIAFANPEVADEWWRALSDHSELGKCIQRITPQLYKWDTGSSATGLAQTFNGNTFTNSRYQIMMAQFGPKMMFLDPKDENSMGRHWEPTGIIPVQDVADLASGKAFYIRSKKDPNEYWFCPVLAQGSIEGYVYASRAERSLFRVRNANGQIKPGTIMVGSDEVIISESFWPEWHIVVENGRVITRCYKGATMSKQPRMKLSDVRTRFVGAYPQQVCAVYGVESSFSVMRDLRVATNGNEEGWELV